MSYKKRNFIELNPKNVKIQTENRRLNYFISYLRDGSIDLSSRFKPTDFLPEEAEFWTKELQSRFIESILIKIPIPAFYMEATENNLNVVDGIQRLNCIQQFVVNRSLRLVKLEYLTEYEGFSYDDLPGSLKRRIDETLVTLHVILPGTPFEVVSNIFHRLNV